jgi:hypothetical protein
MYFGAYVDSGAAHRGAVEIKKINKKKLKFIDVSLKDWPIIGQSFD